MLGAGEPCNRRCVGGQAMTDDEIKAIHLKACGIQLQDRLVGPARAFIAGLFDAMKPIGYIEGDLFAVEEWELLRPAPVYTRPV